MDYDDLSLAELTVLKRMLGEAVRIWDWESPTLYGLSKVDVAKIEAEWPQCLEEDEFRAALAVNNVCNDFLGGSNAWTYTPDKFPRAFGASHEEVGALFDRLASKLHTVVKRHEEKPNQTVEPTPGDRGGSP